MRGRVYRSNGKTLTPISGRFPTIGDTAINDSGTVTFWALLEAGGEGIFVGNGGPLATVAIADPSTPFYEFSSDIDINNEGTVAFTGRLWNGSFGIYAGGDPVKDKVVEIGDFLFGQRVNLLGRPHLNNRGDIAFWFGVRDPRVPGGEWTGIALAVRQSPLPGDYNEDGTVDAADYVVWRKGLGTIYTQDHYNTWRANFGRTAGSGATAGLPSSAAATGSASADSAVPEPTSGAMLLFAAVGQFVFHRRRVAAKNHC